MSAHAQTEVGLEAVDEIPRDRHCLQGIDQDELLSVQLDTGIPVEDEDQGADGQRDARSGESPQREIAEDDRDHAQGAEPVDDEEQGRRTRRPHDGRLGLIAIYLTVSHLIILSIETEQKLSVLFVSKR